MTIRPAEPADGAELARIYNHYVLHTIVTFEEEPVDAATLAARVGDVKTAGLPWLVADAGTHLADGARLAGYAYAGPWKARRAYRYSVEATVYLDHDVRGRGLGTQLYAALFAELERRGIHAVLGGIALPNDASVALHEKFGMTKVAHLPEVGFKLGRWIDVGYWHRTLGPAQENR